jgi:hypothetical protein
MTDTTPSPPPQPTTKQLRVSLETHEKVMRLAAGIKGTADDALRALLGMSTVRVPVTDIQRARWAEAAAEDGVGLEDFVEMRVEAAVQYGFDPGTLGLIYERVNALARQAGLPAPDRRERRPQ